MPSSSNVRQVPVALYRSELSVLGLTHASTMPAMNEVKAAYKKLALVRHPYIYTFFFGCGLALALGGQLLSPRDINTNKAFVYFVFPSRHRGSHVTLASDCHLKTSKPFWRDLASWQAPRGWASDKEETTRTHIIDLYNAVVASDRLEDIRDSWQKILNCGLSLATPLLVLSEWRSYIL